MSETQTQDQTQDAAQEYMAELKRRSDAAIDSVIDALAEDWMMNDQTENVCAALYGNIKKFAMEIVEDDPDSPLATDGFDNALRCMCIIAAIGRNEERECPTDVMDNIIVALTGERDRRADMVERLSKSAVDNITSGVNVRKFNPED